MAEKPEKAARPERPEEARKGKPEKGKGAAEEGKREAKGKEAKPAATAKKLHPENPDFKHIVRIANTDLNGNQPIEAALAAVKGIGIRTAGVVAELCGVSRSERIGNLKDEEIQRLEAAVAGLQESVPPWLANRAQDYDTGRTLHIVATDIEIKVRDDVNRMKKIRCYRGVRHEIGQKVRGQRTRSNGRTGLTVGVMRKAVKEAAAAARKEEAEKGKAAKPAAAPAAAPARKEEK